MYTTGNAGRSFTALLCERPQCETRFAISILLAFLLSRILLVRFRTVRTSPNERSEKEQRLTKVVSGKFRKVLFSSSTFTQLSTTYRCHSDMVPVNDYHTGHPRLAQLSHSSTSNSLSSLQNSPSTSRSTRNLGAIGGRSGPGYSPYARRVSRAAAAAREEEEFEDDATIRGEGESEVGDSPVQQRSGLFGRVKSLPGKALGWLTRSSSSKTLSSSTSLADVRAAVEEEQAKEQGNGNGRGMQRSQTANNLARAADSPSAPSALPSRLRSRQLQKDSLPSSSSMSALSSIGSPFAPSGLRSSHSTLNLASASTNGSGVPSFLTTSNLSRHSRAVSPALSSASYAHSRRSPSPMRNGLAGSMSAFNLAQPRSPTSAFGGAHDTTTLGNAAMTSGSNPFGLTSRSPFAPGGGGRSGSQRAVSVAGSHRSSSTRPEGHALFPYTSTIPRGASPSIAGSQSMREGLSSFASAPSPHPTSAPSTAQKRPYARVGSPLNPRVPFSPPEGEGSQTGGAERARKKQMVWDPARGLVSRERLDMEKERFVQSVIRDSEGEANPVFLFRRDAPPLPKNEAERILEVLEGMGRTPLGEAKRGAARVRRPRFAFCKLSELCSDYLVRAAKEDQCSSSRIPGRQLPTCSIIKRTFSSSLRCSSSSLKLCCLLRKRSSIGSSCSGRTPSSFGGARAGREGEGTKGKGGKGSEKRREKERIGTIRAGSR